MKKLMLMIALFGMSFAFNACTDPVDEINTSFEQEKVTAPDDDEAEEDEGPLDDGE